MSAPAPVLSYPPELPVSAARDEITRAIAEHQVVIVAGATGSGKTTQLPKMCLELGRTRIAHTQPRRIAARSIAERLAHEVQVPLGGAIGYKVRFTDEVTDATQVTLMTDGILLNEIHRDRLLHRYDTIIVDEAHERSLNVDFLLGYLARILPERPDLKVIITSATIDPESFAAHFAGAAPDGERVPAPIIEVSGRTYPVEIRYRAHDEETEDDVDGLLAALRELDREPDGDVLVFLPGEAEIRDAMDAVRGLYAKDARPTEVLPLFGRLSSAEQHRVFEPSAVAGVRRRVILATNVAETSLTVPGIRYVVDTGTARISRYSVRSKIQRLPIEAISQASAQQRSGRAGRTSAGIAIRLYGEDDFAARPEFTEPEILRTSLASVILQMLSLGFGDVTEFPFLTKPDSRGVKAAVELLTELRAVAGRTGAMRLTGLGRRIARLPIDPRFARMLLEAETLGVSRDVLAIVSGLSIQDVRERPEERREEADRLHARFVDPTSDFLTLLNLWNHLREQRRELGSSAFRRLCRSEHLNYVRVREWFDVHRQLSTLSRSGSPKDAPRQAAGAADPDALHRAILSGLLSHIGILDTRSVTTDPAKKNARKPLPQYRGARGASFSVFPGSGLRKASPDAVMAAELVETSRLFGRTVAAIDPAWAEDLAGDLAHRSLSDPHWSKDAGAAVAAEKVTLFGVEIIPRRRVQLARRDRDLARELFLRHALVEGEWNSQHLDKRLTAFERRNGELRRQLERIEERERRRDILVGDEAVYAFYDARVPHDVFDVRSFEAWWRETQPAAPKLLDMTEADLLGESARTDERDFPTRWRQGDQVLSLAYRFEPGAPDDGVSVVVPLALLAQLRPDGFDWQVPGMRDELVTGLIKALPKAIRRHVVPAADWASTLGDELRGSGPEDTDGLPASTLRAALAARIQRVAHQPVTERDFDLERVPAHLGVSFRAVDQRGRTVGSSRDLRELQDRLAGRARESVARSLAPKRGPQPAASPAATVAAASAPIERTGITTWDVGDLPEVVDTKVAGGVVRGYPALVDGKDGVSLRIEATAERAAELTRAGARRLLLLAVPSPTAYVMDHLTAPEKLALAASPYPSAKALIEDARVAVADAVMGDAVIRTEAAFTAARDAFSARIVDELFRTVSLAARILTLQRDVERAVKHQNSMTLLAALGDVKAQLAGLIHPGFLSRTGVTRLAHLPRYLQGAKERVDALSDNPGRDRQRMTEYERAAALFTDAGGALPLPADAPAHLVHARWLLEEFRVSLFAQRLGTAEPVSLQRISKALAGTG
ncbi:ATP-dependent RNA helicase HrpA [Microbacterium sp. EYE_5]|uniref:ATP-dependent RNA helicase HrpA n=1 Tax=unclassified Microbacterium TaxID=2609290 RepID=UPI00200417CE|nr:MULTISPECIES: ATP-dependent RNA helicase HrpA [unclassified Microbacterium]MCK6081175.1 ATP-dependent RNA helicase HrpA [Microbacterium sp. EYE_382]MCK6086445.1 ATP-dependent RNA helicase HrpA [Microbacterium sp. EYE_384]MCK6124057.1 ATP-dependent RNA helicase HrpA [Microbacterium sp. EYE_80]MCK6126966.1 ATP-dependent RNA helicase HrpA [Microbacterium sp. EYE_79]MCK6142130.1 ATP-dependent RNA helicase HrpA [Microbacterium sp. EYE_39]